MADKLPKVRGGLIRPDATSDDIEVVPARYVVPAWPDWRPIETAPKDGTEILIGGYYSQNPDAAQFVVISRWENDDWAHYHARFYTVTHWMPKPDPPVRT